MGINLTLIGQGITFFVFILFTMKFVWPHVSKAMAERQRKIAEGLSAAERGSHELELAKKAALEELRKARQQAAEIVSTPPARRSSNRRSVRLEPTCARKWSRWRWQAPARSSSVRWTPRLISRCLISWRRNSKTTGGC